MSVPQVRPRCYRRRHQRLRYRPRCRRPRPSVFLCDRATLPGGTSSASTKLIHGGLRYLEIYEFRLVQEALAEREVLLGPPPTLLAAAVVLPHHGGLRPWPVIRLGLFIYDHLGGRQPPAADAQIDLASESPASR